MKPVLGLTIGDAAGVGPEITIKALAEQAVYDCCRPIVIGDLGIMKRAAAIIGSGLTCRAVETISEAGQERGVVDVLDLQNLPADLQFCQS